jgi:hypothetical protein
MVLQQIVWVAVACVAKATSIWQTPNKPFGRLSVRQRLSQ